MLCQECQSRSVCQSECPELTLHLKEIEGIQKEIPIGNPLHGKILWSSSIYLTKKEGQIVTLISRRLSREDVCEALNITRHNLRMHLTRLRKKYAES